MDTKTPLLSSEDGSKNVRRHRRTSVTSLRGDFLSKLPDKVRRGLDPEAPFQVDLSKTIGLIEGKQKVQIHLYFLSKNVFRSFAIQISKAYLRLFCSPVRLIIVFLIRGERIL